MMTLNKLRIAVAATLLALAAVSAVDSASAFSAGHVGGYERGAYEFSGP